MINQAPALQLRIFIETEYKMVYKFNSVGLLNDNYADYRHGRVIFNKLSKTEA